MFVLLFAHFIVAIAALTFLQTRPRVSAGLGVGVFLATIFSGDGLLLELAIVLGLLGFLTAVTVARFIERTGQ
jgi:multisubunit Na+/H+ antiporter MnhF subunit